MSSISLPAWIAWTKPKKEAEMKRQLRENWKEYLVSGLIVLWIIAFAYVLYKSAHAGCNDNLDLSETQGICLARRIAELSCFAGFLGIWTWLGGLIAIRKGRNPVIGWILGFALQFMGCFFMLTCEPRRDNAGRMIGWDEYKRLSREQRDAIRPVPVPVPPEMKRLINVGIVVGIVIVIIFTALALILRQVLWNLGEH